VSRATRHSFRLDWRRSSPPQCFEKEINLKAKGLKAKGLKGKGLQTKQPKAALEGILPKLEPLAGIRISHPFEILSPTEQRHVRDTLDAMSRSRRLADTSKGSIRIT
jgi:hypothetical protein